MEDKRETDMKPAEKAMLKEKEAVMQKADSLSSEKIVKYISALKYEFGTALTKLSDKLEEEITKYLAVKKAVEIKEKELQEFYDIQKAASSLSALIEAQNIKKSEFEDEIDERKAELDDEIAENKLNGIKRKKSRR